MELIRDWPVEKDKRLPNFVTQHKKFEEEIKKHLPKEEFREKPKEETKESNSSHERLDLY